MRGLRGRHVAVLAANGVDEEHYHRPVRVLLDVGAHCDLLSVHDGAIHCEGDTHNMGSLAVHHTVDIAEPAGYDALILPGGKISVGALCRDPAAVGFVRTFVDSGRPVAAIGDGVQVLVQADRIDGRTVTTAGGTDLTSAGAAVSDREVCVDDNLITGRGDDLDAVCEALLCALGAG